MKKESRLSSKIIVGLYSKMLLVRYFEEYVEQGFSRNHIHGTTHLCTGQEAVAAGISANLKEGDYCVSNHRGHGHALCKGLDPKRLMAEIMGKQEGYCAGRGGTQHIGFLEKGFLGTNGITGGGLPLATGAGLSIKYKRGKNIAACFFGDGATNQGTFHESLNMASIWKLPVLYVCENNLYAMSTHVNNTMSSVSMSARAKAYNIEAVSVDGMDVLEVYKKSRHLVEKIRLGAGPAFMECRAYRFKGHSRNDPRVYRDKKEEELWLARCPVDRLRKYILKNGVASEKKLSALEGSLQDEIKNAYAEALNCAYPDTAGMSAGDLS